MVAAAAHAHGVLLERAQAGRRLARAGDARPGAGDGVDDAAGGGGDAAQPAEEVERRALAGEQRRARAAHVGERGPGRDARAVGDAQISKLDRGIEQREGPRRQLEAGDAAGAAGHDAAARPLSPAGTIASVVRSPARPRSSASARRSRSSYSSGCSGSRGSGSSWLIARLSDARRRARAARPPLRRGRRHRQLVGGRQRALCVDGVRRGKSRRKWAPRLSSRSSAAAATRRPTVTQVAQLAARRRGIGRERVELGERRGEPVGVALDADVIPEPAGAPATATALRARRQRPADRRGRTRCAAAAALASSTA